MAENPVSPEVPPRRGRRIGRIFTIVGIALAVLLGAALLFLHTSPARRFVVSQVTSLLQQQHIEFNTDELSYNLLNLRLALRNVGIRSQDAPDLPPFAQIDRVSIDLSLTSLLRRRFVIQSGDAQGIAIHYVVDQRGRDNLPRPPSDPEQPSEPLDFLIDELRISDVDVRYEDRARQVDVALPVSLIEIDGSQFTDRHVVRFEAARGTLLIQDRKAALDSLKGALDLGDDDVRVTGVEVAAEGARVTLSGAIAAFSDPDADLAIRGTIDAARAAAIADVHENISGTVTVDVSVKGRLSAPAIQGQIEAANASFRTLSDLQLTTTAAYDIAGKRATFSYLQLRAPFGTVTGNGVLALAGSETSQVTATAVGIDAARLMRAFDLPYIVASRVDARTRAEWPGMEYRQATGHATVVLTPTARASRSVIPVSGRIDLIGRSGAIDAVVTRAGLAGAEVSGRLRLAGQRDLTGTAQVRVGDVARTVPVLEAILGQRAGTLLPVRASGPVSATARLGGTVSSPTVGAEISAPALMLGNANGLALNGTLAYTPAQLAIRRLDVQWQQARARASGTVGLTGTRPLDLTFDADALSIADLLRTAEQTQVPASGTASVHGRVTGTAAQPVVESTINASELVAYGEAWGTLAARATLARRELAVPELVLDKPQPNGHGRVTGTATYHLDRGAYTFDLRSTNLQLTSLTLPDGRPVRGTVQMNGRGAGTFDNPAGTLTVVADDLQVDRYALGRVNSEVSLANQQATVTMAAPTYAINANAVIGVQRPYPAIVKISADSLQLARLPLDLQTPLEGVVRGTVDAALNLGDEGALTDSLQATARIDAFTGAWNGQPFSVEAPAAVRYAGSRLAIDQLRLVAQDSSLAVNGDLPLTESGRPGTISVDARANLATLAKYAPAGSNVTAAGDLAVTGTLRGTLKAIDPDLTLTVSDGAIATPQLLPGLTNLTVRTRVAAGEAHIEQLTASWGAARLVAAGRLPLEVLPALPVDIPRRGGPATFTASVQGLDVAQIPGAPPDLNGRVSLEATLSATRADLTALEGRITFPELQLTLGALTLGQDRPATIALAGGVATVERFALTGSVGTINATGTVALTGDRAIAVDADGHLDIAVLSLFTDAVRAEGDTTLKIAARGTIAAPQLDGDVELEDATFFVDEPTVAAENIHARLDLAGRRVSVSQLNGLLNGGTLTGSGFVELGTGGIADAALELAADDVAFDAPLDLRSLSDARVRLAKVGDEFVVSGQVTLDEAGLTGDINFDEGLLAAMRSRRRLDLTEKRNPFLDRVRFNLDIDTASPILVDNNLARAEVSADLRVIGSPYEPGLSGRLTLSDESEITLNERRYEVERGVITFIGERRILPSFDLLLNTTASNYDITIAVTGIPGETETSLTSDPTLPEPDIMALLVTGRTLEEMRGAEFEIAQEQVFSYLAGRVGSQLSRELQRATGFSTVRIEPNLIGNETDPSARLTVGQEITDDLELVYSTNLTDSNDQIWVAEYDVTRRFQTRGVRQSDNSYRFDLKHDVRIGGRPAPRRVQRQRPTVSTVTITGDGRLPDDELRQWLDLDAGDRYDFFAVRDQVEEIEEELEKRDRLQSRVRLERQDDGNGVMVTLRVVAGPRVDLVFEGVTLPGKVLDEIRTRWRRGVFDTQRIDDSVDVLRAWLMRDNYLQPSVTGAVEDVGQDQRIVRFRVARGQRFDKVVLAFEGASGIPPAELDKIIDQQKLEEPLFTDPTQVTELLERYYREQGFLVASVDAPRYEFQGAAARVVVKVTEGPRFVVGQVTATGNAVVPSPVLVAELPLQSGDPFLPFAAENSLDHIRDVYWRRGYNDVRSDYELVLNRPAGRADMRISISEGPQTVIAGINVQGNDKTSDRLVREQLELQPATPLDLGGLAKSRRNLYNTRAFSVVDITREELPPANGQQPVTLNVSVREVQPVQLRYGLSYDTERGVGGLFDLSNHNSFGKARVLGLSSRYDGELGEARVYMSQPSLRHWPIETTGNIYYRVEHNRALDGTHGTFGTDGIFDIERRGVSIQQEQELGRSYLWNYGYRYERAHTSDPSGALDEVVTVSPLTSTFTRETRDEVLDATGGSFMSQAFSYSPSWLGSDQAFIKYFGQYFHYIPLQRERREKFTNEILRPRFVYAVGVRVGLAKGMGGAVPRTEHFFAGGSTSIRGFALNAVGPVDASGVPRGGDAMLVVNNELRMPLFRLFDGVVFSDIGNVFPRVADFSLTDLRETAGVGLRARTRWFLLRADYGVLLDRRAGERRGRFYFSIGQAF